MCTRFESHTHVNLVVPSGAPQNLAIINSTSTSVTILTWDSVECIHRNGLIAHYHLLVYEPVGNFGNSLATMIISGEPGDGGSYMATGLDPSSIYLFKVAAVNNIGVGPFANITVQTKEGLFVLHICGVHTNTYINIIVIVYSQHSQLFT